MQLCIKKVDTKAVMTVRMKLPILLMVSRFIISHNKLVYTTFLL